MSRFTGFLIGFAFLIAVVWGCQHVHARTLTVEVSDASCLTVRHLSVPGGNAVLDTFEAASFDSVTGNVWNFSGTCGTPPPPDPGAYTSLSVTWIVKPTPMVRTTDVTQFFNVFGHINPNLPVQPWPGVSGVTIKYQDSGSKYLRMHLAMPANPGTLSHFLKAVSYGTSAGMRAKFAIVPVGAPWPTGADTPCYKSSQGFSDQVVLNVNPGAPNTSKCSVAAGTSVDVLVDGLSNGWVALSWN